MTNNKTAKRKEGFGYTFAMLRLNKNIDESTIVERINTGLREAGQSSGFNAKKLWHIEHGDELPDLTLFVLMTDALASPQQPLASAEKILLQESLKTGPDNGPNLQESYDALKAIMRAHGIQATWIFPNATKEILKCSPELIEKRFQEIIARAPNLTSDEKNELSRIKRAFFSIKALHHEQAARG